MPNQRIVTIRGCTVTKLKAVDCVKSNSIALRNL